MRAASRKLQLTAAFVAGGLFGIGLLLSGMTMPHKVIGFLDVAGRWDPTLAFVMAGALAVYALAYRLAVRRPAPWLAERFDVPARRRPDGRLWLGAAIFGLGWGLAGYCPGPGIVAAGSLAGDAAWFVASMVAGSFLTAKLLGTRPATTAAPSRALGREPVP
ncbi:MAG: YeeE/YedE family protein [Myxococcales bacterium]|nr:YeeE/YedE family protein [Myxococcales bacterium]